MTSKIKVNIIWLFEDTEFEELLYEEARKAANLPKTVVIKLDDIEDEDEEEIREYLYENYGFSVDSLEYDD
tara:strand:+ start:442 stop:654 length:213 start_codon:yes stop_codon:yes gene_type:complete